jgi:hypothetical protein
MLPITIWYLPTKNTKVLKRKDVYKREYFVKKVNQLTVNVLRPSLGSRERPGVSS